VYSQNLQLKVYQIPNFLWQLQGIVFSWPPRLELLFWICMVLFFCKKGCYTVCRKWFWRRWRRWRKDRAWIIKTLCATWFSLVWALLTLVPSFCIFERYTLNRLETCMFNNKHELKYTLATLRTIISKSMKWYVMYSVATFKTERNSLNHSVEIRENGAKARHVVIRLFSRLNLVNVAFSIRFLLVIFSSFIIFFLLFSHIILGAEGIVFTGAISPCILQTIRFLSRLFNLLSCKMRR
jgi:hypothetical protein